MIDIHVGGFDRSDSDLGSDRLLVLETKSEGTVDYVMCVDNIVEMVCVNELISNTTRNAVTAGLSLA